MPVLTQASAFTLLGRKFIDRHRLSTLLPEFSHVNDSVFQRIDIEGMS